MSAAEPKTGGMWSGNSGVSIGLLPGRRTFGPLFLMTVCPVFVIFVHNCVRNFDGSIPDGLVDGYTKSGELGFLGYLQSIWPAHDDAYTWKLIAAYSALEIALMQLLPGAIFLGPRTATGHIPKYIQNGISSMLLTTVVFVLCVRYDVINGGVVYDVMGELLSGMNVFALILCACLYVKGRLIPSTADCGTTGNPVFDYYYGTELYPRIGSWDVKQFTNCRFGMMFWFVAPISFAWKQYELYGFVSDSMMVSVTLQLVYVAKFFWWETGYYKTIDIMHDRAGFYLCWGCLVWLPCIYTLTAQYLVEHPVVLGTPVATAMLVLGVAAIYLNYAIDEERERFRAQNGQINTWGKKAELIEAVYKTEDGKTHRSLLLTSGWWGLCRKFNYTLELTAALSWSLPAAVGHLMPYFYFVYLFILLVDRAYRDQARCSAKYGKFWDLYCDKVPYMLVPGVF